MKKIFTGIFMMTAMLALAMMGGEPVGGADQMWINIVLLGIFAACFYLVRRLSDPVVK